LRFDTITLGDVLAPRGYIRGPFGSALKRNELLDFGIPVYEQQHAIYGVRTFRFYISKEKFEEMKRFETKIDDLIISCSGTLGKVSIIRENDPKGIISQALLLLRANTNIILPKYLLYFFSSKKGFDSIVSRSSGSVQVNISKRADIEKIPLDLPPIKEQKIIVAILEALDDKIAINTTINHHLEQMAQAIFKSWFVDFEPWGGEMPGDWRKAELGDVTTLSAGGDKPTIYSPIPTDECSIPVFSNGIDNFGLYGYTDKPKITEESVTVSARGTIGFVCLRQDPFVPIVRLVTAVPNSDFITAKYLYLYLINIHIAGVGTTQQQLTVPDFKKYRILIPSFDAVKDFTNTIEPMFDNIRHKRAENVRLTETRDAMLPKLMSGELSVADFRGAK